MTAVDVALVIILVVSLFIGWRRGFFREVLSLVSWIVALWAAYQLQRPLGTQLEGYIDQPLLRVIAAFTAIFVLVLFAFSYLSHRICLWLSVSGITGVDRSLGILFGVARGALIVAVLILIALLMNFADGPWWRESRLVGYFTPLADALRLLMPHETAVYLQLPGRG